MNQKFNDKVQAWLAQDATERDYAEGAMLLLQLTGNQIMYRNLMANPRGKAPFIEYQLKKRLSFRLQQVTHEQVEQMQAEVNKIVVKRNLEVEQQQPANEFKAGKRADHDQLPDEIYVAAAANNQYIATAAPVKNGRIELIHYIKEQSIANEYHRYGSQIEVPKVED